MTDSSRRAYLRALGATGAALTAGCSSFGGGGGNPTTGNGSTAAETDDSIRDWATTGRDASRAGYQPDAAGLESSPAVEWRSDRRAGGFRFEAPTVADGAVFAASDDGRLYALDEEGGKRWHAALEGRPVGGPPPVTGGAVVIGTTDGTIRALATEDGSERWRYDADARPTGNPVVRDGVAALTTTDGRVLALDAGDGTLLWTGSVGEEATHGPAIGDESVFATGSGDLQARSIDDGSVQWRTSVEVASGPSVVDGTVVLVVGDVTEDVAGFDPATGERLWRYDVGGYFVKDLSGGGDRAFAAVAGSAPETFLALEVADGTLAWGADPAGRGDARAVSVAEDVVYGATADDDASVFAFDRASGERLARRVIDENATGLAVGDGSVYAGIDGGFVRAVDATDLAPRWRFGSTGDYRVDTAVVDGTVYAATDAEWKDEPAEIVALSVGDGSERWSRDLQTGVRGGMTVAGDTLVAGRHESVLLAIDLPGGAGRWRQELPGPVAGAPTVLDGSAHVGTEAGHVAAFALADGRPEWERDLSGELPGPLAAVGGADGPGVVFVAGEGGLRALDAASGADRWRVDGAFVDGPVVAGEAVYVTTGAALVAVDRSDGTERWRRSVADGAIAVALAVDGDRVYAVGLLEESSEGWVQAHAVADGRRQWRQTTRTTVPGRPAVADGTVYVVDRFGRLYALATADGTELWRRDFRNRVGGQVSVLDGRVVVGGVGVRSLVPEGDDGLFELRD